MRTPAYLRSKYAPAAGGMPRSGEAAVTSVESTFPKIRPGRWSGQRDIRVFASQIRTGCGRHAPAHGTTEGDPVEPCVPASPFAGGAGNGTSAYLLRKSAPAAVAYRRPCLLAINASRLFNARTLSGSSPGALLKKARHRNGVVLLLFWSGQRDSNPRVSAWEADALPLGDARLCVG